MKATITPHQDAAREHIKRIQPFFADPRHNGDTRIAKAIVEAWIMKNAEMLDEGRTEKETVESTIFALVELCSSLFRTLSMKHGTPYETVVGTGLFDVMKGCLSTPEEFITTEYEYDPETKGSA